MKVIIGGMLTIFFYQLIQFAFTQNLPFRFSVGFTA